MSVSAETYIVISLMFAVFAAVAAVGTSVVLGAGFERLRAGFELIKGQSGFFADAIYKLDLRTEKLSEDTTRLKAGMLATQDRVERVEKQTSFIADEVNAIGQRILSGSPAQPEMPRNHDGALYPEGIQTSSRMLESNTAFLTLHNPAQGTETEEVEDHNTGERESLLTGMFRDNKTALMDEGEDSDEVAGPRASSSPGIGTLLSRYFQSENDKGVIYH